jgi:hypothetical protein
MGAVWETAAFVAGALGAHNQQSKALVLVHQLFFLLAPLWINAFAYMTFARAVHFYLPDQRVWRIRGASLAKYFVWADVLAFLVQAAGGLMTSPGASASTIQNGLHVYTAGIGLQEAFVLVFVALMICFHREAVALERAGADRGLRERGWRQPLYALYGVLLVISVRHLPPPLSISGTDFVHQVRIIYRIAEYAGGVDSSNPLPLHEYYSYALDALPMMLALFVLAVFHPGRFLAGPDSEFPKLTRADKRALKEQQKAEKMEMKSRSEGGMATEAFKPLQS